MPRRLRGPAAAFWAGVWLIFLAQPVPAALIDFTFGSGSYEVQANATLSVPIKVNSTVSGNSVNWINAGFHLAWNTGVLTLQSMPTLSGSTLPSAGGSFSIGSEGQLIFNWYDTTGNGVPVANDTTLFTLEFTASATAPANTSVSFENISTIGLVNSTGGNLIFTTPIGTPGSVSVVPEPVSCALALFAGVLVVGKGARLIARKRRSSG